MQTQLWKLLRTRGAIILLVLAASGALTFAFPQQAAVPTPATPTPAVASPTAATVNARRDAWKCLTDGMAENNADHRVQAIAALGTIGARPDVVRLVETGLADNNVAVREAAVLALGVMKSSSSVPKLRLAVDDESPVVIFAAAQALWSMGDKSAESIFIEVMSGDRKVSRGTVQAGLHYAHEQLHDPKGLAEIGAEQTAGAFLGPLGFGVAVVAELAKDKTAPARALSARLLGNGVDKDSRDALEQGLDDKSWLVRATAAEALGVKGDGSLVAKLAPLLSDDHNEVRYKAAASIVRIMGRTAGR